ncbi:hypothetical protein BASA82_001242 [Batrachochytrium salamandrivorans]|nr:hypothetical protein BASA82_001242 [Batrachochytrium salamandrivorans]
MSVFCAVYSNIPVYETVRRNVVVMRRISDNQLNATQILKLAGFPKSQRTKFWKARCILANIRKCRVDTANQGTCWERARLRFNVYDLIEPLLLFDPSTDTVFKRASYTKVAPTIVVTETKRRGRPPKHPTVHLLHHQAPAATPAKGRLNLHQENLVVEGDDDQELATSFSYIKPSLEKDSTTALSPLMLVVCFPDLISVPFPKFR